MPRTPADSSGHSRVLAAHRPAGTSALIGPDRLSHHRSSKLGVWLGYNESCAKHSQGLGYQVSNYPRRQRWTPADFNGRCCAGQGYCGPDSKHRVLALGAGSRGAVPKYQPSFRGWSPTVSGAVSQTASPPDRQRYPRHQPAHRHCAAAVGCLLARQSNREGRVNS
jgi:hypothetical protein